MAIRNLSFFVVVVFFGKFNRQNVLIIELNLDLGLLDTLLYYLLKRREEEKETFYCKFKRFVFIVKYRYMTNALNLLRFHYCNCIFIYRTFLKCLTKLNGIKL